MIDVAIEKRLDGRAVERMEKVSDEEYMRS